MGEVGGGGVKGGWGVSALIKYLWKSKIIYGHQLYLYFKISVLCSIFKTFMWIIMYFVG